MTLLVNIDVDDLERAVSFYGAALGLTVGRRLGAAVVELVGGATPVYLLQKGRGTQATPVSSQRRDYSRHWTPVHLDFVVEELDAAVARALAAGATLERPAQAQAWGRIAMFADPFGHGFCLLQFTGRGYDEVAG